jgi:hypothetical protein
MHSFNVQKKICYYHGQITEWLLPRQNDEKLALDQQCGLLRYIGTRSALRYEDIDICGFWNKLLLH